MSDYLISVVDATSAFPTPKENREYQTSNLDDAYDKGWDDCQLYIGTLPSIDAVPVVRCKDCKYSYTMMTARSKDGQERWTRFCDKHKNWYPKDDWFCAYGERGKE